MLITKEFGYRTDYSKVEIKTGQSILVEDNLPAKIIYAENLLLGLRVRFLVMAEVLDSGLFENKDDAVREFTVLTQLVRKTAKALTDICRPNEEGHAEFVYNRITEFTNEMKFLSNMIKDVLNDIDPEEYAPPAEGQPIQVSPVRV